MSIHPLIDLSVDRQVKQAKGFREVATGLTADALEAMYKDEVANAPRRHDEDKKYLGVKTVRIPSGRQNGKDDRHLCMAISARARAGDATVELPEGQELLIIDSLVPLRTAAPDASRGDDDPNKGVDDIDLLVMLPDDRVAVVCTKYLDAEATRGGAGDTPLRALLRGLAQTAMIDANQLAFREEIEAATGRTTSDEAPALIIAATPRYWQLCRNREAQKGAAWIREHERLGRQIAEQIGVEVFFVSLDVEGEPIWEYNDEGPLLTQAFGLGRAWEPGAEKLKPKPKSKKGANAVPIVDADMSRDPVSYAISGSYTAGDRLDHPKLGTGVVQGPTGRGKIKVLFGEDMKILIHERPSPSA